MLTAKECVMFSSVDSERGSPCSEAWRHQVFQLAWPTEGVGCMWADVCILASTFCAGTERWYK